MQRLKRCFLIKSRCRLKKVDGGEEEEEGSGGVAEKGRIDMGRNEASDKEMSQEGDEGGAVADGRGYLPSSSSQITQIQCNESQ